MKFLLDQDVYALTEHFLREQGYDVVTASELGLSRALDSELLKIASEQGQIFVTRDRDYGNLVFVHHVELKKVLESYSEDELTKSFVVVEKGRHRIRRTE